MKLTTDEDAISRGMTMALSPCNPRVPEHNAILVAATHDLRARNVPFCLTMRPYNGQRCLVVWTVPAGPRLTKKGRDRADFRHSGAPTLKKKAHR